MARVFYGIIASIALALICSCGAGKAHIHEDRKYCTGIKADEGVVVLLNTFRSHDKAIESEEEEASLSNCVKNGMLNCDSKLKSISAKEFRHTIFPDKGFLGSPRSSEELLSFFSDPDVRSRVTTLGVRYLVILSATTLEIDEGAKKFIYSEGVESVAGAWRTRTRFSDVTADVLDVKYVRKSGSVASSSVGTIGGGGICGCARGFPPSPCVIPFFSFARTEAEACASLGEPVMKFLIDGHDMVPATELDGGIESEGKGPETQTAPQPASEEELP